MTRYTKEYIAKLLDKYMDGTSTLEEEDVLADYFRGQDIPQEWADYQQLFQEIESMKPVAKPKYHRLRWAAIAAVIAGVIYMAIPSPQTELPQTKALVAQADSTTTITVAPDTTLAAHGYIPVMQEDGTIIYIHEQTELLSYEE